MHITNIDCRGGQAALRTAGGQVSIDSLDGNCVIESQGGNVQASCLFLLSWTASGRVCSVCGEKTPHERVGRWQRAGELKCRCVLPCMKLHAWLLG